MIGQVGFDPGTEWGTGLTSTADNTLRRKTAITAGDTNGARRVRPVGRSGTASRPTPSTGSAPTPSARANAPVIGDLPGPMVTTSQGSRATGAVSATDADGRSTSLAIDSVTPVPATGTIALTGFTPATSDGGTATATLSVDARPTPAGSYTVQDHGD